jgi:membrane associated rhomboid family serine protease
VFGAPLSQGRPVVTMTIIGICAVMFLAQWVTGEAVTDALELQPITVASHPWTLLTSEFIHYGLWHVAINMYSLWVVGSFLEAALGRWRFAALYLLSALGGSLLVVGVALGSKTPEALVTVTAGASGAIFGAFGAIVWVMRRLRAQMGGILAVLAINVVFSVTIAGISWEGHFGGLATGLALGAVYAFAPHGKQRLWGIAGTAAIAALLVVIAALELSQVHELYGAVLVW